MNRITLDDIFSEQNTDTALKLVVCKNATPGLDGMHAYELPEYWRSHKRSILEEINRGNYTPTPLNLFFIPKPGKKEKRQICVCTAMDQMLQHCIRFELEKYFTPRFHSHSYGFIKGRGTEDALKQCIQYMNCGMTYVIDADIRKCFDSIKHRIVAYQIGKVAKGGVTNLISKYLKNPCRLGNGYRYHRVGLPQGSSMSPVIANIVLNNLDWHLHRRHVAFVRYADDLVIFNRTLRDAEKTMGELKCYLETCLSLHLNPEKTSIIQGEDLSYLGHSFIRTDKRYHLSINDEIKTRMLEKMVRHVNKRDAEITEMLDRLGAFNRGWMNYYERVCSAQMKPFIEDIDKREFDLIHAQIERKKPHFNNAEKIILESRSFVLPSIWYGEIRESL